MDWDMTSFSIDNKVLTAIKEHISSLHSKESQPVIENLDNKHMFLYFSLIVYIFVLKCIVE